MIYKPRNIKLTTFYYSLYLLLMSLPLQAQHIISVSDYGVISSDKYDESIATSNTKILNKFLKQSGGNGNTILLPIGRIWISASVDIPSNTKVLGDITDKSIIAIAPSFSGGEGFIENEHYNLNNNEADSFITLQNFSIEGNGVKPKVGRGRGIFFNKVRNVEIKNITVVNTIIEGIRIDCSIVTAYTKDVLIENCTVSRRGFWEPDIMLRSFTDEPSNKNQQPNRIHKIVVRGNTCIGASHGITCFNVADILIENNNCIANQQRGIHLSPTNQNIIIRKNRVDSAGSTGIIMAYSSTNITVDNNMVTSTIKDGSGMGFEGQGIKAYAGFSNIKITNNTCKGNATDGIALEGGGVSTNFTITGNTCESNLRNGIRVWAGEINLNKGSDITEGTILKNRLKDNLEDALFIGSDNKGLNIVKKVRISKNILRAKMGRKKYRFEFTDKSVQFQ